MSRFTTGSWLCALAVLAAVFFFAPVDPAQLAGAAAWTGRATLWLGSWALALLAGPLLLLGIFAAGPPGRHGSVLGLAVLGLAAVALCASAVVKVPLVLACF